jgi:hypothetical protein
MKPEQASWRGARSFCKIKLKHLKNLFFSFVCTVFIYLLFLLLLLVLILLKMKLEQVSWGGA